MDDRKPTENQVIDYQLVQYRIFPVLAQAFACHFTGREMFRLYNESQASIKEGDFSCVPSRRSSGSC